MATMNPNVDKTSIQTGDVPNLSSSHAPASGGKAISSPIVVIVDAHRIPADMAEARERWRPGCLIVQHLSIPAALRASKCTIFAIALSKKTVTFGMRHATARGRMPHSMARAWVTEIHIHARRNFTIGMFDTAPPAGYNRIKTTAR